MSDPQPRPTAARPSKVTLAASLGGASCAVLIFSLFDTVSNLRGVDMRDSVTEMLAEPPFANLEVSVADVIAGMRVMAFVAAALAATGLVLAVYVARRHSGARIGFTVVAALLLLTTPVAGMLTFLVLIAAMLLWSEPARAWFAGREPEPAGGPAGGHPAFSTGDPGSDRTDDQARGQGEGQAGPQPGPQTGPQPGPQPGSQPGPQPGAGERPADSAPHGGPLSPWAARPPASEAPQPDAPQPPPYAGNYGAPAWSADRPSDGPTASPSDGPTDGPSDEPSEGTSAPLGEAPPSGPEHPAGVPYGTPYAYPQQGPATPYPSPYGMPGRMPATADKRPGTVTTAAVLAIVGSLVGLLLGLVLMAGLSLESGTIADQVRQDSNFGQLGWDVDRVLSALWVMSAVLVAWSAIAIVLAVLVLRRQRWARVLLALSAGATALLSLIAILSLVSAITLLMAVATVVLLFTGGANDWFAGRHRQAPPPAGPQGPFGPPGPPPNQQWSDRPGPW